MHVLRALPLLWLLGLPVAWAAPPGGAAVILLDKGLVSTRVGQGVEYLIEQPGERLNVDTAQAPELGPRWQTYSGTRLTLAFVRDPVWIRFKLRRTSQAPRDWLLGVDSALLTNVTFHQIDPSTQRVVSHLQAGLAHGEQMKAMQHAAPLFPVHMEGADATLLMRVQNDSALAVPMTLWSEREFHARQYEYALFMGLLFGTLGVMLLYSLSLSAFTKDRSFLSYSVYLLSIVLYELAVTGYGPFYIWGGNNWLTARGYEFFAACSFFTATLFFRNFLDLKAAAPHLNRINLGFVGLWTVITVASIFPPTELMLAGVVFGGLTSGVAGIYTCVYLARRGNVLALYVGMAWTVIIVATNVTLLAMAGAIEGGRWLDYAQQMGFAIETVLLSAALAERIKRERASKEAAQAQAAGLAGKVEQERDEKIRAQQLALQVQMRANEELELRVHDRTADLNRAMKNLEQANVELSRLSITDALTKVHNRRYFDQVVLKEHGRSARSGAPLALLLADIDRFKSINDKLGHLAGDECLKLVAATLTATVGRSTDLVARYGGEEFAVVLAGTDANQAVEVAERVRRAVEDIVFIHRGQRVPVSISVGVVARVAEAGQAVADFICEADDALYAAKRAGRNRVELAVNEVR